MTKKTIFLLLLFLMVLETVNVNAQVRIGGTDAPHPLAVLDLNANDSVAGNLGLYLPRVSLTSVKYPENQDKPLSGAIVWNTNDNFYLGKGLYVWGDSVWVPVQQTLISNSAYQSVTTTPYVEIPSNSNPELGVGMIFQVPTSYGDWSNTARFIWEVTANKAGVEPAEADPAYDESGIVISGTKQEMVFVPYDDTERTYSARVKPISNNGTVLDDWSEWTVSAAGKYRGQYRLTGPTGYDIFSVSEGYVENLAYGRGRKKMSPINEYAVEIVAGMAGRTPTYEWTIFHDGTGKLVSLGDDKDQSTVELKFEESILTKSALVSNPSLADTIILQCIVNDGSEDPYILRRTITVGNRDECSPVAGLLDAEGNRYTVSKFDSVCWMTQNLRSTWTLQGSQVQTITANVNKDNDPNAVVYYYPNPNIYTAENLPPDEYGFLYTWGAANIGTVTTEATNAFLGKTSDRQGICPDGWTLPSDYDWSQLEKEIATHPEKYTSDENPVAYTWNVDYENNTGWRPKEGKPDENGWGRTMKSPTIVNSVDPKGVSKTDSTGFNALLVGGLGSGGNLNFGLATRFWSSSASSETVAWRRTLNSDNSGAYRSTDTKYYLFSVRCKK